MSNNNFNEKSLAELEKDLVLSQKGITVTREQVKRKCNHKATNKGQVMELHPSNINVPGKKDYPNTTLICTRCQRCFEGQYYSSAQIDRALYTFQSAVEQVKLLSQLSDADWDAIEETYMALDKLEEFATYYNDMVNKLSNKNNDGNRSNKSNTKGHIGFRKEMFDGRRF